MVEHIETVIVGAGQAGLSLSWRLKQAGCDHLLLEKADRLADPWRTQRWDSFCLVTPNWSVRLPGFPYSGGDPDGYMVRDELVRHFEGFADSFRPDIRFATEVLALDLDGSGSGFLLTTSAGSKKVDNVVIATGSYVHPKIPAIANSMPSGILQLHASQYRNPETLPTGRVLVIGSGQSGCQIVDDLRFSGREVALSVSRCGRLPRRYRGRDTFWWLEQTGFFDQSFDQLPEPRSRDSANPHMTGRDGGRTINLHEFARDGVQLLGRIESIHGNVVQLAGDLHDRLSEADELHARAVAGIDRFIEARHMDAPFDPADHEPPLTDGFAQPLLESIDLKGMGISAVIWATGFSPDWQWVRPAMFDHTGFPVQTQGVTPVPGLYFVGQNWLYTRRSGLLAGVDADAQNVAAAISGRTGPG